MAHRPKKRVARRSIARRRERAPRHRNAVTTEPAPRRRLNNLPTELTSFIGREQEVAEIKRLLGSTRLLTLTGSGGCGKTRLALRVAADTLQQYPDGVWFVDLAPIADPAFLPNSIAAALDVPEQPTRPLTDTLADYLLSKTLLLVLDNCEHLRATCQTLVDRLLRVCSTLRVVATSREALAVEGEATYRVPPLRLPNSGQAVPLANLAEYDAIRLFAERAALSESGFTITVSNARTILQICQRLDGIPLAIEFAAARVATLSVQQIASRLDDRFGLLHGTSKTLRRHQTLQATMDWSYDLLSEQERTLLCRLSVFANGWTLEAAEAVCSGGEATAADVFHLQVLLVNKSLVVAETQEKEARYRLLGTVREYSHARLAETGGAAETGRRHRDWYLALAERADSNLRGPEQEYWLRRLEMEHDNLRAALEWSLKDPKDAEAGMRLATALIYFWRTRDYFSEGVEWLERALSRADKASARIQVRAVWALAYMLGFRGQFERAAAWAEKGLHLSQQVGDKRSTGQLLWICGWVALAQGDLTTAKARFSESLPFCREAGDDSWTAIALAHLGEVERIRGDFNAARPFYEESLALKRATGDKRGIAGALANLGFVAIHQHDYQNAAVLFRQSLTLQQDVGSKKGISESLVGFAGVVLAEGEPHRAARLLGAAEGLLGTLDVRFEPAEAIEFERQKRAAQAVLGDEPFLARLAAGRAMTLEQAIDYALAPPQVLRRKREEPVARSGGRRGGLLAPRERAVAALIVEGKSNREIAATLSITESTAETHVQHILNKLGFNSRTQIAAWAVSHGLHPAS